MSGFLVVGGDARTHALVKRLLQEGHQVTCLPGNAGIAAERGVAIANAGSDGYQGIVDIAKQSNLLTIVGPEQPLVDGLGDMLATAGVPFIGPTASGARIEGSKVWCNEFLRGVVPMAQSVPFDDASKAIHYLEGMEYPKVIKENGLAAGKGVRVVKNRAEAIRTVEDFMIEKIHGPAGNMISVDEFLTGREVSIIAHVDGDYFLTMVASQDHKPVGTGNVGPNTGGMGAYAPVPFVTRELHQGAEAIIFRPTIKKMAQHGIYYTGELYAGLMLTPNGWRLLEFNCRFGDPETEVVLPLLKTPLGEIFQMMAEGELHRLPQLQWHEGSVCGVVQAAENYPGKPAVDDEIFGLTGVGQLLYPPKCPGTIDYLHAGTVFKDGKWRTKGGRVGLARCHAPTHELACKGALEAANAVRWRGEHHRTDIGANAG